jgi:hypothetical protein
LERHSRRESACAQAGQRTAILANELHASQIAAPQALQSAVAGMSECALQTPNGASPRYGMLFGQRERPRVPSRRKGDGRSTDGQASAELDDRSTAKISVRRRLGGAEGIFTPPTE